MRNLPNWYSSELPVLLPEIAFEDFGRGQEPENCRIAFGKASALVSRIRTALVINNALAGNNVAPAMPKPFKKERRPT